MERGKGKEGFVDRCNRTVRRETRETKAEIILRGTYDKPWIPVVVTYLPWHALAFPRNYGRFQRASRTRSLLYY